MKPHVLSLRGLILKIGILIGFIVLATWGVHVIRDALDLQIRPDNEQQVHRAIMIGAVAYIGLLALPFVPGAEIGIALLTAFGAAIAPLIYVCTVAAMMLAFTIGRFMPISALERLFRTLRLVRAADLVARAAPLSKDERLAMLLEGQSKRAVSIAVRYRYLAIALAINMPGNSIMVDTQCCTIDIKSHQDHKTSLRTMSMLQVISYFIQGFTAPKCLNSIYCRRSG